MESVFQYPWTRQGNEFVRKWIHQANTDMAIKTDEGIGLPQILVIINHAEQCDLLGDMSREEAIVLLSLWVGRANGAVKG